MPDAPLDPAASDALIADPERRNRRGCWKSWRRLRDPATGCPWDIEQTFATIAPYTIEEAHEVADAIERAGLGRAAGRAGRSAASRPSTTPRWPTRPGISPSPMWCAPSPTRWSPAIRMSSAPKAATRPPTSRPRDWERAEGRRTRPRPHAGRHRAGPARPDPRGETAEPRRAGGVRLALDRRGAGQDDRGGARTGRGARQPDRGRD